MKKLLLIGLSLLVITTGCSKKSEVAPAQSIVGTWNFSINIYTSITNGVNSQPVTTNLDGSEALTFNADGTGIDKNVNGTHLSENFNYTIANKSITITYTGTLYNQYIGTIKMLTPNKLEIYYSYPLFIDDDIYTR